MARSPRPATTPSTRKTAAPYHHGNLREALLEAGLALLTEHGPEALGLRELARHAGVSRTAPYRHFDSKESLIAAIACQGFGELRSYLEEARRREGDDLERWFLEAARQYLRFAFTHSAHYKVMFGDKFRYTPTVHADLHAAGEGAFGSLVNLVVAGQAGGLIRAGNPVAVSVSAWSQLHGYAVLVVHNRLDFLGLDQKSVDALTEQIAHDSLAVIRMPASTASRETTRRTGAARNSRASRA